MNAKPSAAEGVMVVDPGTGSVRIEFDGENCSDSLDRISGIPSAGRKRSALQASEAESQKAALLKGWTGATCEHYVSELWPEQVVGEGDRAFRLISVFTPDRNRDKIADDVGFVLRPANGIGSDVTLFLGSLGFSAQNFPDFWQLMPEEGIAASSVCLESISYAQMSDRKPRQVERDPQAPTGKEAAKKAFEAISPDPFSHPPLEIRVVNPDAGKKRGFWGLLAMVGGMITLPAASLAFLSWRRKTRPFQGRRLRYRMNLLGKLLRKSIRTTPKNEG